MPEDSHGVNPGSGGVPLSTTDDEGLLAGYETIVNTVGDGVYQLDLDGRFVAVNDVIVELTGYTREELIGEHVSLVLDPEDIEAVAADIEALNANNPDAVRTREVTIHTADGTTVPVEVRFSLFVTDGEVEGTVGVTRDISDRRERDVVERIFEAVSVSVAVIEEDGRIVRANATARERLGLKMYAGEHVTIGDHDVYDEDNNWIPPEERPYIQVFDTGDPVLNWECQIEVPERGRRWFSINAVPIHADRGVDDVKQVVVTADDITRRKEQARQIRQQRDDLANELDEVFERIDDAFYAVDDEFRITYVNKRAEELLQQTEAELIGKSVWEMFPEATETPAWESFHDALETQEPTSYVVYYEPLGFWVEASVYPSESGLSVYFRDVTERKEREQELERYETIVETVQDGIYTIDENGRFTLVNEAYTELTGYSREELLGAHSSLVVPDEAVEQAQEVERLLREGEIDTATIETTLQTADGGRVPAEGTFALLPSEAGNERVGVVRDITERKEHEQQLRRERDRFNALFESVPEAVVHVRFEDDEPVVQNVNSEFEAVFGYSREELTGTSLNEYIVPESLQEEARHLDEATMELERQEAEVRRQTADGEREFLFRGVPFEYGDETLEGVGIYVDVTQRKERERELRRYETLFEESTDVNAVLDPDGTVQYITPSVKYVLGYSREELGGDRVFEYIHPEDREQVQKRFAETVEGVKDRPIVEFRVRHADGSWRWLEARGRNLLDDPQIEGVVAYTRDITERVDRKRELQRQREQLAALNDFNRVVRKIADAVVEESTRDEIERAACQQLSASDSYEFAWIADVDPATETITSRVEAGVEGYLDDIALSADPNEPIGQGPAGQAFRTGKIQASHDVFADPDFEPWRDAAEQYGFRSFAAIPVVHEDTLYGVLGVHSERVGAFADDERRILGQLGEVIGHAINAYERKQALMSDEIAELEFLVHDIFDNFDVTEPDEGRITFDQAISIGSDEFIVYGTATEDAFGALEALADQLPHFSSITVANETTNEIRYEAQLAEPPIFSVVAAQGGHIQSAVIEDGDYRLIVELPPDVGVRRITEAVQDTFPAAEVLAQRQITERDQTSERVRETLAEEITSRQRTALESAYHAGFFEWPRESTGEEIAAAMDLAPATFHQHLRAGEKKLLRALFDEEPALA